MAEPAREPAIADPARLTAWLDDRGIPGAGSPLAIRFVSGGASNEIFELARGGHRFALRRPPPELPAGRNETMLREYRVLAALADSDVPHPRVRGVVRRPRGDGRRVVLRDGLHRRLVADAALGRPLAYAVRRRPRRAARTRVRARARDRPARARRLARGGPGRLRQAGRIPDPPGRPLARAPREDLVPRAARPRHRCGLAARAHARVVHARHHPRRLSVRERDVRPRRTGATRGDRRLGDVDDRRSAARLRLDPDDLARSRGALRWPRATSTTPACPRARS